jgi:DNA (cytosine-5)-methyltransferase 3A
MKVLSLFDGMSCGMIALVVGEYNVERYVAFENETKYATKTASHNFPVIEQRGDVFDADFTEFEGFDLLCGGSPCTYWSIAQKNNRETEASGMGWELFSHYVRALHEAKPRFFVYENNKSMSNAIRESITQTFGFEPICINSALVSAQNRQRLYWVGKRNDDGTYSRVKVEQPEDRGVLLKHILEDGCVVDKEKAYCLKHQAGNARDYFKKHHTQIKFEPVNTTTDGKARTLIAGYHKQGIENCCGFVGFGSSGVAEPVGVGYRGRMNDGKWVKQYESNGEEKANALTTAQTDSMVAIPIEFYNEKPIKAISASDGKAYAVYEVKDGQITINCKTYSIKLADGFYIIRKLTVRECMRLQTVPEWYEFPVSDTQAYKMLGNGWTVEVISHILSFMDF